MTTNPAEVDVSSGLVMESNDSLIQDRRLRIAVLNRVFSPTGGGAERYSIALVEELAQRHEIHVFAQQIEHQWPGVVYHKVSSPITKPRWINQLWFSATTWLATRRGFDVVHSHENTWHGQVQTVHVLPVKYNLFHGRKGWQLAMRLIKVVTSPRLLAYLAMEQLRFRPSQNRRIVVTSPSLNVVMEQTYAGGVLSIIPPGVLMPQVKHDRLAAKKNLGLIGPGPLLAFVANDYEKKGLSTLLEALALLPVNVELAIVGNPLRAAKFQQKVKALGLVAQVHFLGHLRDVSPLYVAADVLAHPTTEDTFAMVVLEAMAFGLPVVVSDPLHCGISGFLENGVNALILTNPSDVPQLAEMIWRILDQPILREELVARGRDFAEQWSWTKIAHQYELMYRQVVSVPV